MQRNVSEAFDFFMRQLDARYAAHAAAAPEAFDQRIAFWHASCGMPDEVRRLLHKLRVWRNAALHHDAERWASDGPRSATEASKLLEALEAALNGLEAR